MHQSFVLFQNYPNPFNPTTRIQFQIPEDGFVTLIIYDLLGKEMKTLLSEEKSKGIYTVIWDGKDKYGNEVSSGVYCYRLKYGSFSQIRNMMFLK